MAGEWDSAELVEVLDALARRSDSLVPRPAPAPAPAVRAAASSDRRRTTGVAPSATSPVTTTCPTSCSPPSSTRSMTYSSALYADGPTTRWPRPRPARSSGCSTGPASGEGTRVLEIGTGWGELAVRAARRGADVVSVTLSVEQARKGASSGSGTRDLLDSAVRAGAGLSRGRGAVRCDRQRRDDRGRRHPVVAGVLPHARRTVGARRPRRAAGDRDVPRPALGDQVVMDLDPQIHLPGWSDPLRAGDRATSSGITPHSRWSTGWRSGRATRTPSPNGAAVRGERRGRVAPWDSTRCSAGCGASTWPTARPASGVAISTWCSSSSRAATRRSARGATMRVAVTGSRGLIGSALTMHLVPRATRSSPSCAVTAGRARSAGIPAALELSPVGVARHRHRRPSCRCRSRAITVGPSPTSGRSRRAGFSARTRSPAHWREMAEPPKPSCSARRRLATTGTGATRY